MVSREVIRRSRIELVVADQVSFCKGIGASGDGGAGFEEAKREEIGEGKSYSWCCKDCF